MTAIDLVGGGFDRQLKPSPFYRHSRDVKPRSIGQCEPKSKYWVIAPTFLISTVIGEKSLFRMHFNLPLRFWSQTSNYANRKEIEW
jgi:hypothetical protein